MRRMNATTLARCFAFAASALFSCNSPPSIAPATHADVGPGKPAHADRSEQVAVASSLSFHSAFWPNLHHVLYAEAWSRRAVAPRDSLAGVPPTPLSARLTADERAAWDGAVEYYDRELAAKDLLFDATMDGARRALLEGGEASSPKGLPPAHEHALTRAAAVYRRHFWPAHDRANREWIADAVARVRALSPIVPDRLAALYRTPWFAAPVRVDVVFVGKRQGAYTALTPAPAHITISSTDSDSQGWAGAEIVFHEASHALVRPVVDAFAREAERAGKSIGPLWHVALFDLTGEVVRQTLAARGVEYEPYIYATGLFDRAWPVFKGPIESHWRPYVNGASSLDDAVARVVDACPAG